MSMIQEAEEKLKRKLKKLSSFIVKNNISRSDILDMCLNDDNAQVYCDIIGKTLDYFEWRVHPNYPYIECSTDGQIRVSGTIVKPQEWDGKLKISCSRKMKLDAAQLILTTFRPMPTEGKYVARFRNEDYKDLRVSNLYWYKLL